MSTQIRPGLASDLPAVVTLDMAANHDHPVLSLAFPNLADCYTVWLDRYTHFWNDPECHLIVATSGEEVVGFLFWKKPVEEEEKIAKWEPTIPESVDVQLLGAFIHAIDTDKAKYDNDGLYELEVFAVSPTQQRRGIGSLLLKEFLKSVDGDHVGSFIVASAVARPLYERFGWKVRGEFHFDLSEHGRKGDFVSYDMKRDGVS